MAKTAADSSRYEFLDALRGYAICGVVATHVGHSVAGQPIWLANLAFSGRLGVDLFFIVSGLTLAMNYAGKNISWSEFCIRRFFRLAPMFYVGAIVYAVLGYLSAGSAGPAHVSILQWVTTFTFTHGWLPQTINGLVPGSWSIADEVAFYVTFPLLILTVRNVWLAFGMLAVTAVLSVMSLSLLRHFLGSSTYELSVFSYFFWLTQWCCFAAGIAIYAARTSDDRYVQWFMRLLGHRWAPPIIIAAMLIEAEMQMLKFVEVCLLLALFSATVAQANPRYLVTRYAAFTGRVSYSIYIVHFAVLSGTDATILPAIVTALGPAFGVVAYFAIVLTLSTLVAWTTFTFIEKPGIRLGKSCCQRVELFQLERKYRASFRIALTPRSRPTANKPSRVRLPWQDRR